MISWPFLVIPLIAWLSAQIWKFAAAAFGGEIDFKRLYQSGGMPSAHTALITSATVTIGVIEGGSSALFGLALALSVIIVYDALGVRRSSGLQADAIRLLYGKQKLEAELDIGTVQGHTPKEVLFGGLLGSLVALGLTFQLSLTKLSFLIQYPDDRSRLIWLIAGIISIPLGRWLFKRSNLSSYPFSILFLLLLTNLIVFVAAKNEIPYFGYNLAFITLVLLSTAVVPYALYYWRKLYPVRVKTQKATNKLPNKHRSKRKLRSKRR